MIALDGRTYRLAVKNTRGWQGVDCENGVLAEWDAEELEAAYTAGGLTFLAEGHSAKERAPPVLVLPDLSPRQQAETIFRAKFLIEVSRRQSICASVRSPRVGTKERLAPILADVSAQLGRKNGVSIAAFYRWRALSSEGVAGLVERRGSKTGRRCLGAPLAKQVMAGVIQGAKQTRQVGAPASITMAALEKLVRKRIKEENLSRRALWPDDPGIAVPSKSTLSRIWKEFPADDRAIVEHGATKARAMFRGGPGIERPEACLDLVEYDETPLPHYFFDEESGAPLGHAWLSWYLDVYSGVPIGFYLGFEPPSDLTICSALRHACLPKTYVKDAYPAIQNRYVGAGVPRTVTFDNGLSQWGKSIETIGLDLNMTIQFATVRTPWFKPRVEGAFNGLNKRLLREMPGFVLGRNMDRKDYDPSRHGCIGIRHFLYIFHAWLIDIYLQQPGGMFQTTPAELWAQGTAKWAPELISSATDLDILFGVVRKGRLDHRGVVYESLRYHSPALHTLRRQVGDRLDVEVKINPSDLGAVHVRHHQSPGCIRAEATEQRYARGLSLHRHKLNLRFARDRFGDDRIESLHRAEDFLHELIAESLPDALSIRTNSRIARALGIGTQNIFDTLDHEGNLGELRGPFAGQPLNPFAQPGLQPAAGGSKPDRAKNTKRPARIVPNFDADHSLGKGK
jgi:hypothetical protein